MSVLDRMHKRQAQTAATSDLTGQSSTQEGKPPVIQRLEYVVNTLHSFVEENGDGQMARFSYVARAMIEEVSEELTDRDDSTLEYYMAQIGEVIAWIGHGDNSRLPIQLQETVKVPEIEQAAS